MLYMCLLILKFFLYIIYTNKVALLEFIYINENTTL